MDHSIVPLLINEANCMRLWVDRRVFDKYIHLRGECQESLFNTARALHQIGLVHFYRRTLDLPVVIEEATQEFDLTREIGYNLACIYHASGNTQLAHCFRKKYLRAGEATSAGGGQWQDEPEGRELVLSRK